MFFFASVLYGILFCELSPKGVSFFPLASRINRVELKFVFVFLKLCHASPTGAEIVSLASVAFRP
jgi:hypothetical protein